MGGGPARPCKAGSAQQPIHCRPGTRNMHCCHMHYCHMHYCHMHYCHMHCCHMHYCHNQLQ